MDLFRKRATDYSADHAYREAVTKLKYLLADSYTPVTVHKHTPHHCTFDIPIKSTLDKATTLQQFQFTKPAPLQLLPKRPELSTDVPPEFMSFLRRQEEYIERLEKESQCSRGSKKKPSSYKSTGPNIVLESKISELEAQLTQYKLELRKAQDEVAFLKTQTKVTDPGQYGNEATRQIAALQRERDELNETISSLQVLVNQLKDKEASATQKVKRSLDLIDQTHFDKNQVIEILEMEVRRLKCELERMNDKQRESIQEAARRVTEAERRYTMQIERLNNDLAAQWDTANRLNLDLDRARRTEQELRRDLAQKNSVIEELKKELTTKTNNLQSEALTAGAERESLESELAACRLALERAERSARQETSRLQAEVASLRQRIDRADADLLHSRKENLRLSDNIATLEKEAKLGKNTTDGTESKRGGDDLTTMIKEMDAKHVQRVAELEGMIQSQTQLMEKLKNECQNLTDRLEDSTARHKEEIAGLQNNIEYLNSKLEAPVNFENQEWRDGGMVGNYQQDAGDYERVEDTGGGRRDDLDGYDNVKNYPQNGQNGHYGQNNEDPYTVQEQYRNDEMGYGNDQHYDEQAPYDNQYENQGIRYDEQHGEYTQPVDNYNNQSNDNYATDQDGYPTQSNDYPAQSRNYVEQPENYSKQEQDYITDQYDSQPGAANQGDYNQQSGNNYIADHGDYNAGERAEHYPEESENYPQQRQDYLQDYPEQDQHQAAYEQLSSENYAEQTVYDPRQSEGYPDEIAQYSSQPQDYTQESDLKQTDDLYSTNEPLEKTNSFSSEDHKLEGQESISEQYIDKGPPINSNETTESNYNQYGNDLPEKSNVGQTDISASSLNEKNDKAETPVKGGSIDGINKSLEDDNKQINDNRQLPPIKQQTSPANKSPSSRQSISSSRQAPPNKQTTSTSKQPTSASKQQPPPTKTSGKQSTPQTRQQSTTQQSKQQSGSIRK
ncbi:hypothetical protein O3M35_004923 [Rhynocoris fuscipes]|uniref:Uncharacterized protein n=1 Tax=Rhynocoris fuscipes TaxID=488301 RepID=A0AAW1DJ03_9HEMI